MNVIIPMAGMGTRLRPHTLKTPKPLIKILGKPIVERLVTDIKDLIGEEISEVGFVVGNFGKEIENDLISIAERVGAKGKIFYQEEALGTAHAVYCAKNLLKGKTIIAFADTLFEAEFKIDTRFDASIWVKEVEDPSAFGVVKTNDKGLITEFVEKPKSKISNKAIIGIYYFKKGELLKEEIEVLIKNDIKVGKEYQLTTALERLKDQGLKFCASTVNEWLDFGNKESVVISNKKLLELGKDRGYKNKKTLINSIIIEPCYIGNDVKIENSIVGPFVSIGDNSEIINSRIENSLIQEYSVLERLNIANSMIGNYVEISTDIQEINVGDYSIIKL
jgi:glucose-1-phosphate thymidylyltransferase